MSVRPLSNESCPIIFHPLSVLIYFHVKINGPYLYTILLINIRIVINFVYIYPSLFQSRSLLKVPNQLIINKTNSTPCLNLCPELQMWTHAQIKWMNRIYIPTIFVLYKLKINNFNFLQKYRYVYACYLVHIFIK